MLPHFFPRVPQQRILGENFPAAFFQEGSCGWNRRQRLGSRPREAGPSIRRSGWLTPAREMRTVGFLSIDRSASFTRDNKSGRRVNGGGRWRGSGSSPGPGERREATISSSSSAAPREEGGVLPSQTLALFSPRNLRRVSSRHSKVYCLQKMTMRHKSIFLSLWT